MVKIKLDMEKCNGCAACVEVCPFGVFKIYKKKAVVVNPDRCLLCMACEAECPYNAIKVIQ